MRLSQKVFWIFFSITFATLILSFNQFVTFYSQERYSRTIEQINKLQGQVRQLNLMHMALFQSDQRFDKTEFDRLLDESSSTSKAIRSTMTSVPIQLQAQLDSMDFNLGNFGRALHELAETRRTFLALETVIHDVLRRLHLHENLSTVHINIHQTGQSHEHSGQAGERSVGDQQLYFLTSSYLYHRQFERLPEIKQAVARLKNEAEAQIFIDDLDLLVVNLEKYYQLALELADHKQFVEGSTENFLNLSQQMLKGLEKINTQRQRLISQISLVVSIVGVLGAIIYWYRIRFYIRRFLSNQNKVMQAIQTDTDSLELASHSNDELGQLTRTMQDLSSELKSKKDDLLVSERKYRSLVETLNEWIWETDASHCFSYCSRAGEMITGHSQDVMLGRKYLTLSKECEEQEIFEHIEQHFRKQTEFTNIERKILCADGSLKHLIASGMPLYASDGAFLGFRGVDRDITALVQAREAQEQLESKLLHAQKMESIGRLAGGVAHDFNNILSAIIGYTELILLRLEKDHKCYRYVGEIKKSGDRAAGLTKQLLAFSRKQSRKPRNLDLGQELTALEDMLRRLVGEHVSIEVEIEKDLWPVLMDKSQLEQVIANLVVNARDAMPGGGEIWIALRNCAAGCDCRAEYHPDLPTGDYVQLTVSDTGCGMPEDILQSIFDPFFTTKDKDKGTGLGLAMVYGVVTQNQGDISVVSEVGKGTSFRVLLPRSSQELADHQPTKEEPVLRKGSETILFVEDEAALRKMHSEFLNSLGYRVLLAVDGVDALDKYRQAGSIDMLITDVVMPNLGGIELAQKLRAVDADLKVLYTSGYTDSDLSADGVLQEGVNFIYKPATPVDIANMIEKLLD